MGFGSGYSRKSDNGGKRYSNSMTAHVWNAQSESAGQSSNGNLFFRRATLYSYGTHFVVGYIMPDGLAVLNADSYSVSTSGHQSDARGAISDRRRVSIASLTDIAGEWKLLPRVAEYLATDKPSKEARDSIRSQVRVALLQHATAFRATIYGPGAESWRWNDELNKSESIPGAFGEFGAYLAALVGLPAATWPAIVKERARLDAKAQRDAEAAKAKAARDTATRLASMSDKEWREVLAMSHSKYESHYRNLAKSLYHARRYAKAHGFSDKRRNILRDREAQARDIAENYDSRNAIWRGRAGLRSAVETFRACQRLYSEVTSGPDRAELGSAGVATKEGATRKAIASLRLLSGLDVPPIGKDRNKRPFPMPARLAMWALADRLETETLPPLADELAAEREREREAERARIAERAAERARSEAERAELDEKAKADWLAGIYNPRRPYFDAPSGGAALRIVGDELQTSHGADVPLSHAVKVFRFVKLCRDKAQDWQRNGKTIRVGHFQVDKISASGDFVAGCHSFTWQEVERVAKLAGVFEAEPSAEAVEVSHA